MKRFVLSCLTFICLVMCFSGAYAEGILPSLDDFYDVSLPSLFDVVKRAPDERNTLEDESTEVVWNDVTEEEYKAFGEHLSDYGCEMIDYSVEGNLFIATVSKEGHTFLFTYDSMKHYATNVYPKGTYAGTLEEAEKSYIEAIDAYEQGDYISARLAFRKIGLLNYRDSNVYMLRMNNSISGYMLSNKNDAFIVAVKRDGTVASGGDNSYGQRNVSNWNGIIGITSNSYYTVGIKEDGTVIVTGERYDGDEYNQLDIMDWTDIVDVACGFSHTVGLKSDGSVTAKGDNMHSKCNVNNWKGIVAVDVGLRTTIGLKQDGSVVYAGYDTDAYGVTEWKNIIDVAAGRTFTIGLQENGKVVASGIDYGSGISDVEKWTDIVQIAAGDLHVVGLKKDGTVVVAEHKKGKQSSVKEWKNIVAIAAVQNLTIGLQADGTIVSTAR